MVKRLGKVLASMVMIAALILTTSSVSANNTYPTLTGVYEKEGHVVIEWAIPMDGSEVLTETNFDDGIDIPELYGPYAGHLGNQSFILDGSNRVLVITDTQSTNSGNDTSPISTTSIWSNALFPGKSAPNSGVLSINFRAKATSGNNSRLKFYAYTGLFARGYPVEDDDGRIIKYGTDVNFNFPPNQIELTVDGGGYPNLPDGAGFILVSSHNTDYNYGYMYYSWDDSLKRLVISPDNNVPWSSDPPLGPSPIINKDLFVTGEPVLVVKSQQFAFPERIIPADNEWHTISMNIALVGDSTDYDYINRGIGPVLTWTTDSTLMVDDIKFGYASEAELYRDGESIYQGFLSDFEDTWATDRDKPDPPTNIKISLNQGKPEITWDSATDNGTTYNYQLKATKSTSGIEYWSDINPITVTSGIEGYSIVVDDSPDTIPPLIINSYTNNYTGPTMTDREIWVHLIAIDRKGNASDVVHMHYEVPPPDIQINNSDANIIVGPGESFTLSGTVQGYSGKDVEVFAVIGGVEKRVLIPNPDIATNWQLNWNADEIPEGQYTNVVVQVEEHS